MELAREQLDKIRTIMKEDNLESIIDRLFCELNGLESLGSTDEGHLNYSLNEYWLFACGFVHGFITRKGLKKRNLRIQKYGDLNTQFVVCVIL